MKIRLLFAFAAIALAAPLAQAEDAAKLEFFEKKIRPLLANHCAACHSAETSAKGNLRIDDRNGLITGGNTGKAIVPGKAAESLLIKRVTLKTNRRMPLEAESLSEAEIDDLTKWINDGAAWPPLKLPASLGKATAEYAKLRKEHWAYQPVKAGAPPAVKDSAWPRGAVDQFVLSKLEANKLKPVGDADRLTLIRRVTFDLTGLPPTPAEIAAFVNDPSPKAYEALVDRLLASPQYAEQWARHWLDVARYGESTGPSRNIPYPFAWRYRDYVIDAISNDVPFNRFIEEQIAGDLLEAKDKESRDRLATATGLLALGVKDVNQRFKVRFQMDNVDEQIDAVSRSILGLTVSCARCHDHKFDPVPTTDYYALAGIFTSTENAAGVRNKMGGGGLDYYDSANLITLSNNLPPVDPAKVAKLKAAYEQAKKEWDAIRGTPEGLKKAANGQPTQRPFRLKYEKLAAELASVSDPASRGFAVHGVRDAKTVADTEVRIRGEAEKLGPTVPRGFLTAFDVPGAPKLNPAQSGRLELAEWLTNPKNPLTPRVFVNRVWYHLFDQGLVSTVDNFGTTGNPPSHPELLDYLANRFVQEGWSTKKLIRELVLTRTYQLSANADGEQKKIDPANKLLWRHAPRRLNSEEIRDAVLASAGTLAVKPSPEAKPLRMIEMRDNGPEAKQIHETAEKSASRSLYLPLFRGVTPKSLEAFDPVEQTLVTGQRDTTTVPSQALFLLNASFIRKQSLALAEKLLKDSQSDSERIEAAYHRILGRSASPKEIELATAFVADFTANYQEVKSNAKAKPKVAQEEKPAPENPDEIDQTGVAITEYAVQPKDARHAAWMAYVQALYGTAEFRYIR